LATGARATVMDGQGAGICRGLHAANVLGGAGLVRATGKALRAVRKLGCLSSMGCCFACELGCLATDLRHCPAMI
jgi:hypothetical protein